MSQYRNFDARISNIDEDAIVWRYLDLAKFLDLFAKRRIYFRRSDLCDDKFEGTPTRPILEFLVAQFKKVNEIVPDISSAEETLIELRETNFVNCWHMSRYESAAMWSLYAKVGSGIAIRSTVKRLRKAIPADVFFGMIMYVDYKTADFRRSDDIHSLLFLKRNHFEHERELRILYTIRNEDRDPGKAGHYVEGLDLHEMIESIVLSPQTAPWLKESVTAFLDASGFPAKIVQSDLDETPLIGGRGPL